MMPLWVVRLSLTGFSSGVSPRWQSFHCSLVKSLEDCLLSIGLRAHPLRSDPESRCIHLRASSLELVRLCVALNLESSG